MLRITGQDERIEEWLRPIPFPRHRVNETHQDVSDTARLAEEALDRVQHDLDELHRFMGDPLPFQLFDEDDDDGDDGPSAA